MKKRVWVVYIYFKLTEIKVFFKILEACLKQMSTRKYLKLVISHLKELLLHYHHIIAIMRRTLLGNIISMETNE